MPNPEWGVKRTCQTCGARFYDLMRDPIVCPSCGSQFDISSVTKVKRGKPAAKMAATVDDDEDLIDEDEDALDEDEDTLDEDEGDDLVIEDDESDDVKPAAAKATPVSDDDDDDLADEELADDDEDDFAADVLLEDEEDADDEIPLDEVKPKGGEDD